VHGRGGKRTHKKPCHWREMNTILEKRGEMGRPAGYDAKRHNTGVWSCGKRRRKTAAGTETDQEGTDKGSEIVFLPMEKKENTEKEEKARLCGLRKVSRHMS